LNTLIPTDRSLLLKVRAGDDDAATRLYLKYVRQLQAVARRQISATVARRVDAEDVVQSAFRSFFRRAGQGQFDVPQGGELWKLLLTIALNKARNATAKDRAAKRGSGKDVVDASQIDLPASDEFARKNLELVIEELTTGMEPSQRQIIELRIAGLEVDDIARQTGRARRSVERVLQGFRNDLASTLEPREREP
jgi:RNA polymerase sigma-70 factor, ECF subfamily